MSFTLPSEGHQSVFSPKALPRVLNKLKGTKQRLVCSGGALHGPLRAHDHNDCTPGSTGCTVPWPLLNTHITLHLDLPLVKFALNE